MVNGYLKMLTMMAASPLKMTDVLSAMLSRISRQVGQMSLLIKISLWLLLYGL